MRKDSNKEVLAVEAGISNPKPEKYDVSGCSLAMKEEWFKEAEEEYKKKAEYIIKHDMFNPFDMVTLTESGLSVIIHQVENDVNGTAGHKWALGCMSHGKHLQTEQVSREFLVKILRYFADSLEKGGGYFGDKKNSRSN